MSKMWKLDEMQEESAASSSDIYTPVRLDNI